MASVGDEVGDELDEEDVLVVGEEGPKPISFSMRELERQLGRKGGEASAAKAWTGRGTPPSRRDMIDWLLSVGEGSLARRHSEAGDSEEEGARRVEKESSGKGKGKGKGKGSSKKREQEAEQRHVRRQEEGRSK